MLLKPSNFSHRREGEGEKGGFSTVRMSVTEKEEEELSQLMDQVV